MLIHLQLARRSGIDGHANGAAPQPKGVLHTGDPRLAGVLVAAQGVGGADFKDQWNLAREVAGGRFEEPQWRGAGVATAGNGQVEMIAGIVRRRIWGE
jgi:hypothetical protein